MRKLIRVSLNAAAWLARPCYERLPDGAPREALVHDIGQSGTALFVPQGLPKGQDVEITFKLGGAAAGSDLARRDGYVVRSRANADGNVVGVEFTRALSPQDLRFIESNWLRS